MKLDLNDLVEHVEKNSKRVTPLEHQFLGGLQGFAVGGTAFDETRLKKKIITGTEQIQLHRVSLDESIRR